MSSRSLTYDDQRSQTYPPPCRYDAPFPWQRLHQLRERSANLERQKRAMTSINGPLYLQEYYNHVRSRHAGNLDVLHSEAAQRRNMFAWKAASALQQNPGPRPLMEILALHLNGGHPKR